MTKSIQIIPIMLLSACAFNSTRTPVGTRNSGMFAAGIVSWDHTDTYTNFDRDCRAWLKPGIPEDSVTGKPKDMALPDRALYATCFANYMQNVEPGRGQASAPVPIDVNGDGYSDYFQWSGVYIPANAYMAYGIPGYYAPGAGAYTPTAGYSAAMRQYPGTGVSDIDGAYGPATPPQQQGTQKTSSAPTESIQSPWPKNGPKPASQQDVDAIGDQVEQNTERLNNLERSGKRK
jgi:hypothetical protein